MKYSLRHVTTYTYAFPVTFAQCTLVLTPVSNGRQRVDSTRLVIAPHPRSLTQHRSFFGHLVTVAEIDVPHRTLRIEARGDVDVTQAPLTTADGAGTWEAVRSIAQCRASLDGDAPVHALFPSPRIRLAPEVTDYARKSFTPGCDIVEAAADLMRRIRREFRYDPDATRVSTPLLEAFEQRHGVCQDFAHIMIAGLRGLGLPARYVSGYIRTIPPPGQQRLEGADATHAWVDLWCGEAVGWIGFDPTNAIMAGNDHVILAYGRDYADVAPVGGILLGAGNQDIMVNVDLVPHEDWDPRQD